MFALLSQTSPSHHRKPQSKFCSLYFRYEIDSTLKLETLRSGCTNCQNITYIISIITLACNDISPICNRSALSRQRPHFVHAAEQHLRRDELRVCKWPFVGGMRGGEEEVTSAYNFLGLEHHLIA